MKNNRIVIIVLGVLLAISVSINIKDHFKKQNQIGAYVDRLESKVSAIAMELKSIQNYRDVQKIIYLNQLFEEVEEVIQFGQSFLEINIGSWGFKLTKSCFSGSSVNGIKLEGIATDGIIDNNELKYIGLLRTDIEKVYETITEVSSQRYGIKDTDKIKEAIRIFEQRWGNFDDKSVHMMLVKTQ